MTKTYVCPRCGDEVWRDEAEWHECHEPIEDTYDDFDAIGDLGMGIF